MIDPLKPRRCEVCGYKAKKSTTVVQECADGIWRCHVCREKAMFGKYTSEREAIKDITEGKPPPKQTEDWKQYIKDLGGDDD